MSKKLSQILITLFLLGSSQIALAGQDSEACRSCVKNFECTRSDKVCNANCTANLYQEDIDLESCRGQCARGWEKCVSSAKSSCSYYCSNK